MNDPDPIEDGFDQPDMILLCSNYPYTNKLQPLPVDLKQLRTKSVYPWEHFRPVLQTCVS